MIQPIGITCLSTAEYVSADEARRRAEIRKEFAPLFLAYKDLREKYIKFIESGVEIMQENGINCDSAEDILYENLPDCYELDRLIQKYNEYQVIQFRGE